MNVELGLISTKLPLVIWHHSGSVFVGGSLPASTEVSELHFKDPRTDMQNDLCFYFLHIKQDLCRGWWVSVSHRGYIYRLPGVFMKISTAYRFHRQCIDISGCPSKWGKLIGHLQSHSSQLNTVEKETHTFQHAVHKANDVEQAQVLTSRREKVYTHPQKSSQTGAEPKIVCLNGKSTLQ